MKYEKAKVEVIQFNNAEFFMINSGDVAGAMAAAKEKFGFEMLDCATVAYSGGKLSCSGVSYRRTGALVTFGPRDDVWSVD